MELKDCNFEVSTLIPPVVTIECDYGSALFQGEESMKSLKLAVAYTELCEESQRDCLTLAYYSTLESINKPKLEEMINVGTTH